MRVYVTDDGFLMEDIDFNCYVFWLIDQYRLEKRPWEIILTENFWGDQLLVPKILNEIKEFMK